MAAATTPIGRSSEVGERTWYPHRLQEEKIRMVGRRRKGRSHTCSVIITKDCSQRMSTLTSPTCKTASPHFAMNIRVPRYVGDADVPDPWSDKPKSEVEQRCQSRHGPHLDALANAPTTLHASVFTYQPQRTSLDCFGRGTTSSTHAALLGSAPNMDTERRGQEQCCAPSPLSPSYGTAAHLNKDGSSHVAGHSPAILCTTSTQTIDINEQNCSATGWKFVAWNPFVVARWQQQYSPTARPSSHFMAMGRGGAHS